MDIRSISVFIVLILLWIGIEIVKGFVAKKDMRAYYKSPIWAQKRKEAFAIHGNTCAVCGSRSNIQVHHLRYRKWLVPIFGRENVRIDLMILCKDHHPRGRYSRLEIAVRRMFYKLFGF